MPRRTAAALGATVLLSTTLCAAPARAAGTLTVVSRSCGVVRADNAGTSTAELGLEFGDRVSLQPGYYSVWRDLPGGRYVWRSKDASGATVHGVVTVKPCVSSDVRRVEGDEDGDGRADVLGITRTDGRLYYYRTGSTGLANGVEVGHGWSAMTWMQRVDEIDGARSGRRLVSARSDGTIWMYTLGSKGKVSGGQQVGQGFQGYDNLAVMQLDNGADVGWHTLVASKGGVLYAWPLSSRGLESRYTLVDDYAGVVQTLPLRDFDGDGWNDLMAVGDDGSLGDLSLRPDGTIDAREVGNGWTAMDAIYSPGDLTGDGLPDLVGRRKDDHNLYRYTNTTVNGRHAWATPVRIGRNWGGIRLFA